MVEVVMVVLEEEEGRALLLIFGKLYSTISLPLQKPHDLRVIDRSSYFHRPRCVVVAGEL